MTLSVRSVRWEPCWRIVAAKHAEDRILGKLADAGDLAAVAEIEESTNDRLREERGELRAFKPEDRATGPGRELVMAAFAYRNPEGSRFSDGGHGVYYAARDRDTAVAETKHHRERFMRRTNEGPMLLEMRALRADLDGDLHDLRGLERKLPEVYRPNGYAASQALAAGLARDGSEGIAYDSVRREGGQCAAVFRPRALSRCRPADRLIYEWDGKSIAAVYDLKKT